MLQARSGMCRFGAAALLVVSGAVQAHGDDHDRGRARMSGFEEVPALSTTGRASFEVRVGRDAITYELSYRDLESDATQAHIHLGQKSVNGGIVVFLCSNLGNGPAGTQACPLRRPGHGAPTSMPSKPCWTHRRTAHWTTNAWLPKSLWPWRPCTAPWCRRCRTSTPNATTRCRTRWSKAAAA